MVLQTAMENSQLIWICRDDYEVHIFVEIAG